MPSDVQALLSRYDEAYRTALDFPAPIEWGKDNKLAKTLLARYTVDQLTPMLAHYFVIDDPFIRQGGYTFGVFYKCLGKVIADYQRKQQASIKEQMIRDRQRRERDEVTEWRNMSPAERARKLSQG